MSFARVFTAQTELLRGQQIAVEADISRGLHTFSIVGLPDKAVEESKDRVASAIKNTGFDSPKSKNEKIVISLSPSDIKKEGSYFDLAIALSYLLAGGLLTFDPEHKLFLGELSLSGEVKPIKGALPLAQEARSLGFSELFVPYANREEAALIDGITVYGVETLSQIVSHLRGEIEITPTPHTTLTYEHISSRVDMNEIRGQEAAKRGLEIAAAGGHNIALSGPPGTGKTMLARAFQALLPSLSTEDALEVTGIHSIVGLRDKTFVTHPPFRSPHHTASYVSIIGGGTFPKPGEVTLAHKGVLFLDEFPEFDKRVIESLRQPLEDNVVSIARAKGTALFPSNFILVAAMNPCPCGYLGSTKRQCICTPGDIARYARKISGPITDRIDLWVTVSDISYETLTRDHREQESSSAVSIRIKNARTRMTERFKNHERGIKTNSEMNVKDIEHYLTLSHEARKILNESAERFLLSARAYHRVLKLARTIADLDKSPTIEIPHILEAIQYRPRVQ